MPTYQFRITSNGGVRTEEFGLFNDEGALRYAARYGQGDAIEVRSGDRTVGVVRKPAPTLEPALPTEG